MFKLIVSFVLIFVVCTVSNAQTQKDTIYTNYTKTPVVIDGSDADACWAEAQWHAIDKIWLPSTTSTMEEGDFEGKFKVAWDSDYLYILVEVIDDVLNDDFPNPFDNYWNDDCVEIFIDEDRSKGNHQFNYNAFAYHVSVFYDVIDGGTGTNVNLKNNLKVVMDTIAENTYRWEFAVKIFNKNFNPNNIEASRVKLTPNKLMGFSIAYCDNDGKRTRENFIGSMIMTEATKNDNYITADYFGTMLLVDRKGEWVSANNIKESRSIIYPNPVLDMLNVDSDQDALLDIYTVTGLHVRRNNIFKGNNSFDISLFPKGSYILKITGKYGIESKMFTKD